MTALHNLTGDYLELSKNEDFTADEIKDTLEAIQGTIEQKAVSLASWSLDLDGNIAKIDAEIDRLNAKKKQIQNRKDSLTEYMRSNMDACGINKISCPLFSITLVAGRDVVAISDDSLIPDEFMNVKVVSSPDKVAILKALKAGEDIQGASIQKSKPSIRIK